MKKALLVLNPGSRNGRGRRHWAYWMNGLTERGLAFETVQTRSLPDARALAAAATAFDPVVAVGGDGTIGAVLSGLSMRPPPRPRMGVLYAGTSPDYCRFHGIPVEPQAALATLLAGRARSVDVAAIRYRQSDGREEQAAFGCSCNIGLGAGVAARANRWRRWAGDRAGTALALLRTLAGTRAMRLEVELDGVVQRWERVRHLAIVKNPWLASGLRLDAGRRADDGQLTVVAVTRCTRLGFCRLLPHLYNGTALGRPGVQFAGARQVAVRSDAPVAVEFDGDPQGWLPVAIAVEPLSLELIV
jgi:diacylglycerol kinase (ATP)